MMKIHSYIFALMAALLMAACSEDLSVENENSTSGKLRLVIPTWADSEISTRAGVTTKDIGIQSGSMQLLCFDSGGFYLGMGDGTTITPETDYKGTMTAKVPTGTCRIHFFANANIVNDAKWIGLNESTLIASLPTATEGDNMVYWGYKKFDTPEEMKSFLEGYNEVLMLRNEAKVSVEKDPQDGVDLGEDEIIGDIYLTVCQDLKNGTLAPFDYSDLDNPFAYDESSDTKVTLPVDQTMRNEPTDVDEDKEQFIFESPNNTDQPLKVVLKVTYKGGDVKYHLIQLRDINYALHKIRRNHNYVIKIQKLDKDLGYDSFDGAKNGNPSNNPSASVDDIVPEVSKDAYTLRIIGSTSVLYNETGLKTVQFQFLGDNTMTAANFKVEWSYNNGISEPSDLTFSYDNDSQKGTITFPINKLTGSLQSGTILVRDTKYGLERNVKVYAVNKLDFNGTMKYYDQLTATIKETEVVEHTETVTGPRTKTILLNSASAIVYTAKWSRGYYYDSPQSIAFTLEGDDDITSSDISVAWKSDVTNSAKGSGNPSISSYSNGTGYISVPITGPTDRRKGSSVYSGTLVLTVKGSDYTLTREITIYTTMNQNNVTADLTPAAATTATVTRTETYDKVWYETKVVEKKVSGSNVYALTFKIPKSYPSELLPVEVKIATNELQPYNSMNQLGVVVESTEDIGHKDWNYWYTYSADETNFTSEDDYNRTYTIYFKEIRSGVTDKGNLYLKADHFTTATVDIP